MDIHKPKPVHSWREFLKEYAIIVLGVATALAAEQAVEWLHWQHRIEGALESIKLELRDDDGPAAYTRAAAVACYDKQLDGIQAAIEDGRSRADITTLTSRYAPPVFGWDRNAWDAVLASDIASHVAPDRLISWGLAYSAIPQANALASQEGDNLIALASIRRNGDKLSAGEADTMLTAVSRLRAINQRFGKGGAGFLRYMAQTGVVLTDEQKAHILAGLRARYPDCVVTPSGSA